LKKRFKILTLGPNPKTAEGNSGNSTIQAHLKKRVLIKNGKNEHEKSIWIDNWSCKNKIELI
jgi:hypothetical protein